MSEYLRITNGAPTVEELAALTTVLTAAATRTDATESKPAALNGRWNDPAHAMRQQWPPGPGGWRSAR